MSGYNYNIGVRKEDYPPGRIPSPGQYSDVPAGAISKDFAFVPPAGYISGTVRDNLLNPMRGVHVYAHWMGNNYWDETDVNGDYSIDVTSGNWNVGAHKHGYTSSPQFTNPVPVSPDATGKNFILTSIGSPLTILTTLLPNGVLNRAYSQTLSATGGLPPYTWSITAGSLPTGLSLSGTGVISGTPTATGTFNFTVQAQDSYTPQQTDTQALSITIRVNEARDIYVPQDYPTIQAAIDAAVNGDTVWVNDGTYTENINFKGKAITVRSVNAYQHYH